LIVVALMDSAGDGVFGRSECSWVIAEDGL